MLNLGYKHLPVSRGVLETDSISNLFVSTFTQAQATAVATTIAIHY